MGAVFANGMNLTVAEVSWFMMAFGLGGMFLQWPMGRLSDSIDRRKVIVGATAVSTVAAGSAIFAGQHSALVLIAMMAVYGALSVPLYSLFIAHTNDHLESRQRVAASGGLVMVGGLGAVLGPTLCATVMDSFGAPAFFAFLASIHAGVTLFGVWRMYRRAPVPVERQQHYVAIPPRSTAIAAGIASRTMRDARDRDLARWSDL